MLCCPTISVREVEPIARLAGAREGRPIETMITRTRLVGAEGRCEMNARAETQGRLEVAFA